MKDKLGYTVSKTWYFTVNAPPSISELTPAENAIVKVTPSAISAKVSDADGIDPASLALTVDGVKNTPAFDPATGIVSWTPTTTYPSDLNIVHNVKLEVKDTKGVYTSKSWGFRVYNDDTVPPRITNLTPTSGSILYEKTTASATISDYNGINTAACTLTLNGNIVPCTYTAIDSSTGTVTAPLNGLAAGIYNLVLTVVDTKGNPATATWSFTLKKCVRATGVSPTSPTALSSDFRITAHFGDELGHTMSTSYRYMEVTYPDGNKVVRSGDGAVSAWHYIEPGDEFTDPRTCYDHLVESISLPLTQEGTYTVTAKAQDELGNTGSYTWTFYAGTPPSISEVNPAYGTIFYDVPPTVISAKVSDPDGINPSSIIVANLEGDYGFRNHTYDPATGIVSWNFDWREGGAQAYLHVKDTKGVPAKPAEWNFRFINNPPVIDQKTPAHGAAFAEAKSPTLISARVSDPSGIDTSSIKLSVAGVVRPHIYDPLTGVVSWQPLIPFGASDFAYPVKLEVKDIYGKTSTADWHFIVMAGPQLVACTTSTSSLNFDLFATIYDPWELRGPGYLKLDGKTLVEGQFDSRSDPNAGSCGSVMYPEPIDPKKLTISQHSSYFYMPEFLKPITDGAHAVEVMATNAFGLSRTFNWDLWVAVPPKFTDYPADGTVVGKNRTLAFKVVDPNGNIDPNAFKVVQSPHWWFSDGLDQNEIIIPHSFDPSTGYLTVRPNLLVDGQFWVRVEAFDTFGNRGFKTVELWGSALPPQILFKTGKIFYPGEPLDIQVDMKSFHSHINPNECSLQIDGKPVNANVTVQNSYRRGESLWGGYALCTDGPGFDSYRTGTGSIKYQGNFELTPGTHTLTATATDIYGGVNTQTWPLKVEQTAISDLKPQGYIVNPAPTVEATLNTTEYTLDKETVKLVIDKAAVEPQITAVNGLSKISYSSATLCDNQFHEVKLTVTDANSFRHTKSWWFCATAEAYPLGLSKPTPAPGAVGNGPVKVIANNANGTMGLNNTQITFTHLTAGKTYQGAFDVIGQHPVQTITGWYVIPAAWKADANGFPYFEPERKAGLDVPLEAGSWRVIVTVPNISNPTTPYTITWDFTAGSGQVQAQSQAPAVRYAKPSGATISKKPNIVVGFTEGTYINSATQWVELLVDGQKITENVVTTTTPYQDGFANIYGNSKIPASIVYKPTTDLAQGNHTVLARYYNVATGATITSKEWTFKVETPDLGPTDGTAMGLTDTPCVDCHGRVEKIAKLNFIHPLIYESGWTDSSCLDCHTKRTHWDMQATPDNQNAYNDPKTWYTGQSHPVPRVDCARCHGTASESNMASHPSGGCGACHMADGSVKIIPDVLDRSSINNCTGCHEGDNPGYKSASHTGAPEFSVANKVGHNMDDGHLSETTGCTTCHSRILTKEHARAGRTDGVGNPLNCDTCHSQRDRQKTEVVELSGIKITLTESTQVAQKIYYPPKGKKIAWWSLSGNGGYVYALINGQWVHVSGELYRGAWFALGGGGISWNNKVNGADALMLFNQTYRLRATDPLTLTTPQTTELTRVYLISGYDKVRSAVLDGKTGCMDCHDANYTHTGEHSSSPDAFCLGCHKNNLITEHMNNSTTQYGNKYTCDTCHKSSNTTVKNAITNHLRSCQSCHGVVDHDKQHEFDLGPECKTCHKLELTKEHMSNPATQAKTLDCGTCHNSAGNKIVRSIQNNSLYCGGCHQVDQDYQDNDGRGHKNVVFADKVPADIPLYDGFDWTSPEEAAIYNGDKGTPAGYSNGQVVLSNRQNIKSADGQNITLSEVWTYYSEQLKAKGWTTDSQAPAPGVPLFSVEFEKDGRYVTVKCYNTDHNDGTGTGDPVDTGYRIELWYTHSKTN